MIDNIDYGVFKNKENLDKSVYEYRLEKGYPTESQLKDGCIILPPTVHVNIKNGEIK